MPTVSNDIKQFLLSSDKSLARLAIGFDLVDTIDELRNVQAIDGDVVRVLGYRTAGDGGGGPIRFFKTTGGPYVDNGGSVIVPNGGDGTSAWLWGCMNEVNARWFGAIESENSELYIFNAIKTGSTVVLDGVFPVTRVLSDSDRAVNSVSLIGVNSGGIVFSTGGSTGWFRINDGGFGSFNSVSFESPEDVISTLTGTISDTGYIASLTFTLCKFTGGVCPFRTNFSKTTNPSELTYGIGKFVFTNNKANGCRYSFVVCASMPHTLFFVCDNEIRNFHFVAFRVISDNDHSFPIELKASQKKGIFLRNRFVNDPGFETPSGAGEYHGAVIYEGLHHEFCNNHTEGLMTNHHFSVFDNYSEAEELVYENNVFKNCISFSATKTVAELMRAKKVKVARYRNNVFTIEESFVNSYSDGSVDKCWVTIHTINEYSGAKRNIENNVIDVYAIARDSRMAFDELNFKGNRIRTKHWGGVIFSIATEDYNMSNSTMDITDNEFLISDAATPVKSIVGFGFGKPFTITSSLRLKKTNVSRNNVVIGTSGLAFGLGWYLSEVSINRDNVFSVDSLSQSARFRGISDERINGQTINSSNVYINRDLTNLSTEHFLRPVFHPDASGTFTCEHRGGYAARGWLDIVTPSGSNVRTVRYSVRYLASGKVYSGEFSVQLTGSKVFYTNVGGVLTELDYVETDPAFDITPQISKLRSSDSLVTGLRFKLDPSNPLERLQIETRNTSLVSGQYCIEQVELELM
jgi:hypothetical protein